MSILADAANAALRVGATAAHTLLKAVWSVRRPKTFGAHAVALTPEGKVILVKLRYAPGWRIPGGGRGEEEDPLQAALRELGEEIGMIAHGEARLARDFEEATRFRRDTSSVAVVRDVRYRPSRWSWEIEQICEADPHDLPDDMSAVSARWIEALRPLF